MKFDWRAVQRVGTATVEKWDLNTASWTSARSMPEPVAAGGGAVRDGGKLFIYGGSLDPVGSSAVYAMDVASETWTSVVGMPSRRTRVSAAMLGTAHVVCGGRAAEDKTLGPTDKLVDTVDATHTPTSEGGTMVPTVGPTAAATRALSLCEAFDPIDAIWATAFAMPTARFNFLLLPGTAQVAHAAVATTLFSIGGFSNDSGTPSYLNAAEALVRVSARRRTYSTSGGWDCASRIQLNSNFQITTSNANCNAANRGDCSICWYSGGNWKCSCVNGANSRSDCGIRCFADGAWISGSMRKTTKGEYGHTQSGRTQCCWTERAHYNEANKDKACRPSQPVGAYHPYKNGFKLLADGSTEHPSQSEWDCAGHCSHCAIVGSGVCIIATYGGGTYGYFSKWCSGVNNGDPQTLEECAALGKAQTSGTYPSYKKQACWKSSAACDADPKYNALGSSQRQQACEQCGCQEAKVSPTTPSPTPPPPPTPVPTSPTRAPTRPPTRTPTTPAPTPTPTEEPTTPAPSCGMEEWSPWGECSTSCGGGGTRQRYRAAIGAGCVGDEETEMMSKMMRRTSHHRETRRDGHDETPDETCLASSCSELKCDPPGCCVCFDEMPVDLRAGQARSKNRLFVYRETSTPITLTANARTYSHFDVGLYDQDSWTGDDMQETKQLAATAKAKTACTHIHTHMRMHPPTHTRFLDVYLCTCMHPPTYTCTPVCMCTPVC